MTLQQDKKLELLASFAINLRLLKGVKSIDERFYNRFDPSFRMWVDLIYEHVESYNQLPTAEVLKTKVNFRLNEIEDSDERKATAALFQRAFLLSIEIAKLEKNAVTRVGLSTLKAWLEETERIIVADAINDANTDVAEVIEQSRKNLVSITAVQSDRFKKPFEDGMELPATNFQPTGIGFVDRICDGGLCGGEIVGHQAPIGSGKTTLCLQIVWERIMRILSPYLANKTPMEQIPFDTLPRVYMFVYEVVVNLRTNFVSHAGWIHRDTMDALLKDSDLSKLSSIKNRDYKPYEQNLFADRIKQAEAGNGPWPKGELERFEHVTKIANNMLMFGDFSGANRSLSDWTGNGVQGIRDFIDAHQESVGAPGVNLVVIDYVGTLVTRWESALAAKRQIRDRNLLIKQCVDDAITKIAAPENCPVWAAHQLNSLENKRDGGVMPDPNSAEGSGMFLENTAVGFASGKLSNQNAAVYVTAKQRRTKKTEPFVAQLSSTYARWEDAPRFVIQNNSIVDVKEARSRQMQVPPSAKGRSLDA